jgi:hypothetical protein
MPELDALAAYIDGLGIRIDGITYDNDNNIKQGMFLPPDPPTRPRITITRPRSEQDATTLEWAPTAVQRREVLFTMAHELGHYLSWRGDTPRYETFLRAYLKLDSLLRVREGNRRYGAAAPEVPPSDAEMNLIMDEEERAWRLGREHIPAELREAYDAHGRRMLQSYREAAAV